MKTLRASLGILTIMGTFAAQVHSQTSNFIATLTMDFTQNQNLTTPVLPLGGSYFFLVSGRYGTGPGDRGEAMHDAAFSTVITSTLDQYHVPGYGWQWNGTSTNRPTPDVYQTNHVYRFEFTGRGTAEVLSFYDGVLWDNIGTLTFQLYEVVSGPSSLTNGLVAYYPFNGNANDASGNGNHASTSGTVSTTDRFGQSTAALYFNRTNSIVNSPDQFLDIGADYTLSIWFCTYDSLAQFQTLVGTTPNPAIDFAYNVAIHGGDLYLDLSIGNGTDWLQPTQQHGPKRDYVANQWYHAVATKSGSSYATYVNGVLDASFGRSPGPLLVQLLIGAQFFGVLDDVRIYNRALSAQEVGELYDIERPWLTDGLIAYYPFNGNANDVVGTNHGTIYGATLTADRNGEANRAYSFNGMNKILASDQPLPKGNTSRTISLWVNCHTTATNRPYAIPFWYGTTAPAQGNWINVFTGNDGTSRPAGSVLYDFYNTGALSTNRVGFNQWQHLVCSLESPATVRIYINGQLAGVSSVSANTVASGTLLFGYAVGLGAEQTGLQNS